jgi:hypothetical protein
VSYSSTWCFRLGLKANHQMLAMVASTPSAAAGLAILRERSDIPLTLPRLTGGANQIQTGCSFPRRDHGHQEALAIRTIGRFR